MLRFRNWMALRFRNWMAFEAPLAALPRTCGPPRRPASSERAARAWAGSSGRPRRRGIRPEGIRRGDCARVEFQGSSALGVSDVSSAVGQIPRVALLRVGSCVLRGCRDWDRRARVRASDADPPALAAPMETFSSRPGIGSLQYFRVSGPGSHPVSAENFCRIQRSVLTVVLTEDRARRMHNARFDSWQTVGKTQLDAGALTGHGAGRSAHRGVNDQDRAPARGQDLVADAAEQQRAHIAAPS
jgi:hypothetical protein